MVKYLRNNVVFRFSIFELWVFFFRILKIFRGEKFIKFSKGRRVVVIKSRLRNFKCFIVVFFGKVKYELEYGVVVWYIDQLLFIYSKILVDVFQIFICVLDFFLGMEYLENYKFRVEFEYDVVYVLVFDIIVIVVKVFNQNILEKWVCYRVLYYYDINIEILRLFSGLVRDVGCMQQ